MKDIWANYHVGFFDRLSSLKVCGSGEVVYLPPRDFFHFCWFSREGSNTRENIIELWGALFCANWLTIEEISAFGDSKVMIDWVNMRSSFESPVLKNWMMRIIMPIKKFKRLSLTHIHREKN